MCCTFAVARLLERMALLALLLVYNISAIQTTHSRNPLCCLSLPGEDSFHCCALCLRGSGGGDSRALVAALGQPARAAGVFLPGRSRRLGFLGLGLLWLRRWGAHPLRLSRACSTEAVRPALVALHLGFSRRPRQQQRHEQLGGRAGPDVRCAEGLACKVKVVLLLPEGREVRILEVCGGLEFP